jgi:hypothetical protein
MDIYYKHIEIHHKCTTNILKYTIHILKYIHVLSNILKGHDIHYKDTIHIFK